MVYKSWQIFLPFCHNLRVWRTDRQTDRPTDRILIARPRLHSLPHGKNYTKPCIWLKAYAQNYSYIVDFTIGDTTDCVERKYYYRSMAGRTQ